ncbi:MAG: phosphatidate cytidylyltransferase [Azoarcus sp.]|nr:phosphatidate cytidylyltransferase [Azoarcus sp.]
MLRTRIVTAVFLLAGLSCALFFFPPMPWVACCALICAVAAWEWAGLAGWSSKARIAYGAVLGISCFILGYMGIEKLSLFWGGSSVVAEIYVTIALVLGLFAVAFWLLIVPFWLKYKWPLRTWNAAVTGVLVLLPPTLVFIALRAFAGPEFVLMAAALVWVADIAAYFSGRAFGRRKLAPNISPGKTWAGAVGATLGVMLYGSIVSMATISSVSLSRFLLLQLVFIGLSVLSIVGDLFESLLKRQAGVKDSSNLLPGHGGVLDRIDSLTSTLPMVVIVIVA